MQDGSIPGSYQGGKEKLKRQKTDMKEYDKRLKRLIRQAEFEQPDASIEAIDYHSGRKLNKVFINRLATCEYITEHRNIFITGATGSGKTYIACALGIEACKHHNTVQYVRFSDLLLDFQSAKDNSTFAATLKKYTKPDLLIIDEWLFPVELARTKAGNLFELIRKRSNSLILLLPASSK